MDSVSVPARIFFSWQLELSRRLHQGLIRKSLALAAEDLVESFGIRFEIDEATRDEAGSPVIDQLLQERIEKAVLFVADVSGTALSSTGRTVPNANVLVETGMALEALGHQAIILVFNDASGEIERLPFDIRNRRLCRYRLEETAPADYRKAEAAKLKGHLREALEVSLHARFFEDYPEGASRLIEWLNRNGTVDGKSFPVLGDSRGIAQAAEVPEDLSKKTLDVLCAKRLIESMQGLGRAAEYRALQRMLVVFDPIFLGWDAVQDALRIGLLLNERGHLSAKELAVELGWTPRRLNPAVFVLEEFALCHSSQVIDADSPFRTLHLRRNERTALVLSRKSNPLRRLLS